MQAIIRYRLTSYWHLFYEFLKISQQKEVYEGNNRNESAH